MASLTHASININPSAFIFSTHCSNLFLNPGMEGHWFSPHTGLVLSGFLTGL
jgi:hypothetical protein